MQVTASVAAQMITAAIRAKLVPLLIGSPGCGKSQIVHQIAQEHALQVIDLRLAQCDPCDINGFPTFSQGKAGYAPMDTFPIAGDPLPEGKQGWLLFLDEMTSAPPAVQAAAYKLVLDRQVGKYHLHDNLAIVCAGNLESDNAIVQPMSTALQSRLVHMELAVDTKEWLDWAASNDIDHRITAYINFRPENLYTFKPDHTDHTYAAPRTWEFANRLLKQGIENTGILTPLLSGTLSEGVAREFINFTKIYKELPTIQEILADPEGIKVPEEPGTRYAITGSISHHMKADTADALMKYIMRLPIEFQVVCLRETIRRHKELLATPAIQAWIAKSASELF